MAWTSPITFAAGEVLTAAQLNTYLRDNLNETAPAKATTPGGIFVTTGANTIAERVPVASQVTTSQQTSSTSFVDLTTVGPAVTTVCGSTALVMLYAGISHNTANFQAEAGYAVSGATTIAASNLKTLQIDGLAANDQLRMSAIFYETTLTPGSNTFTMKYRVASGGTGTFENRQIVVIPL